MKQTRQMSETIKLGILLAFSGGFMDAYSYIQRDQVFANAQTGNMLLFGVNLSEGNLRGALHYFFPVFAFAIGIAIAELVRAKERDLLHWRQVAVLFEGIILVGVAFIPLDMNLIANSLTSFACGIQVESFRKIRGNGIATTMCIGNLRSGTQNLCNFIHKKDKEDFKKAVLYYGIIVCFVTGAVIGNFFIHMFHERAILCCSVILFFAFFLMFIDYEKDDARAI
ncbi:MAG: DUF1275 domain-containing protein [Eubacterium ventriosum]|nr:DUF1275 domain-containing protein [Eubacterium ventriosum]